MDYRSYIAYARASLGMHLARLRAAVRDGDRGASAVELAFITAGLLVVAGVVYAAITLFVNNQKAVINNTTTP
jgi:hypothetical protein